MDLSQDLEGVGCPGPPKRARGGEMDGTHGACGANFHHTQMSKDGVGDGAAATGEGEQGGAAAEDAAAEGVAKGASYEYLLDSLIPHSAATALPEPHRAD